MKLELLIIIMLIIIWLFVLEFKTKSRLKELNKLKKRVEFLEIPEYRGNEFEIEFQKEYSGLFNAIRTNKSFKTKHDLGDKVRIGENIYKRKPIYGLNVKEYTYETGNYFGFDH